MRTIVSAYHFSIPEVGDLPETEKLYDLDSHMRRFTARVLDCRGSGETRPVLLDRTAFFPEGGGQGGDRGSLGEARVLDTHVREGVVLHTTDRPLEPGSTVEGVLDWDLRFRRMQDHSGEHIVSGLVHQKYGFENVGFHLGDGEVTLDFSGELSGEQLAEIELLANRAVTEDLPVEAWYPDKAELARTEYRSKLDLTENVRLVRIPGIDVCACCAPHVKRTGEIGLIKILDFMRHRGGVRVNILCGRDALEDYDARYRATRELSGLLSAKQLETPRAVRRLLEELEKTKYALSRERQRAAMEKAEALEHTEGHICLFFPELDMRALRELVNAGMEKCTGVCAAFTGGDGDWKFIMGSRHVDLRAASRTILAGIGGRGGGSPEMLQGSAAGHRDEIEAWFAAFPADGNL